MPKTILIVDDNESNMRLFCDLLEGQDHRVVRAEYGLKGLRLARESRPNLIVMDLQLPDVSGIEVVQWIKSDKALKHIPIIVTTAFAIEDAVAARLSGCEACITKPIDVRHFLETVDEILNGSKAPNKATRYRSR